LETNKTKTAATRPWAQRKGPEKERKATYCGGKELVEGIKGKKGDAERKEEENIPCSKTKGNQEKGRILTKKEQIGRKRSGSHETSKAPGWLSPDHAQRGGKQKKGSQKKGGRLLSRRQGPEGLLERKAVFMETEEKRTEHGSTDHQQGVNQRREMVTGM